MESALEEMPEVLAIIPARGGSKGVSRKNIRDLCGKPLIAYSIEVAQASKGINRVIVSTEDEEIAEVSKQYGAEVPFLRPEEFAQDRSNVFDGVYWTINELRICGYVPDAYVTLFPTHPFRTPRLLNSLVSKTLGEYTFVYTVKTITHSRFGLFGKNDCDTWRSLLPEADRRGPPYKKSFFRTYGTFFGANYANYGSAFKPYIHVIKDPITLIDIDTLADFCLAEEVIRQGLFDFSLA